LEGKLGYSAYAKSHVLSGYDWMATFKDILIRFHLLRQLADSA
jgi:hypothetical protein